jgi:hypothetical protein
MSPGKKLPTFTSWLSKNLASMHFYWFAETMNIQAGISSKTLVKIRQSIWRHIPEKTNFINTAVRT